VRNYVKFFDMQTVRVQDSGGQIQHGYRRRVTHFEFFDDADPAQNVRAHQIAVANATSSVWSRPPFGGWAAIPQVRI
jgi:hypothetical protein